MSATQMSIVQLARARRSNGQVDAEAIDALGIALEDAQLELTQTPSLDAALLCAASDALGALAHASVASWTPAQRNAIDSSFFELAHDLERPFLDELGELAERISDREHPLPAAAELEDWARVVWLFHRACAEVGDHLAMEPYSYLRDVAWNHGYMLFTHGLKGLARDMFLLLRDEADRRGDVQALAGMKRNLRAT